MIDFDIASKDSFDFGLGISSSFYALLQSFLLSVDFPLPFVLLTLDLFEHMVFFSCLCSSMIEISIGIFKHLHAFSCFKASLLLAA